MSLNLLKTACLLLAGLLLDSPRSTFATPGFEKPVMWIIDKSSTLQIDGKSNVNSFTCAIDGYNRKDTIISNGYTLPHPVMLSGSMKLRIVKFDCHSALINKDFRKTLKENEYPEMNIRFLNIESMPGMKEKSEVIKGSVEVEVAGVTKKIEIDYSFSKASNGLVQLKARYFRFSDFNLKPPRKLAGLIRIKDDFAVSFQLMLRMLV